MKSISKSVSICLLISVLTYFVPGILSSNTAINNVTTMEKLLIAIPQKAREYKSTLVAQGD